MIRRDALQPADGDGLFFDATTTTRGFARAIADATENSGKDIRFAIDEIRIRELTLCDQSDVFRYIRVSGAGPLTIYDAMKVIRISGIGRFHLHPSPLAAIAGCHYVMTPQPSISSGSLYLMQLQQKPFDSFSKSGRDQSEEIPTCRQMMKASAEPSVRIAGLVTSPEH